MSNKDLRRCKEKYNTEKFITIGNFLDNPEPIYEIASKSEIKDSYVNEAISLLGYQDALTYTNFFVKHSLPKELFLEGVTSIVNKSININNLKTLTKRSDLVEKSNLEISVQDTISQFNFTKKQLKQKDKQTKPKDSSHYFEHIDSRIDRQSDTESD